MTHPNHSTPPVCPVCGERMSRTARTCKPCATKILNAKKRFIGEGPNPSGLCQCGCEGTTRLARKSDSRNGNVRGKPVRFLPNHNPRLHKGPEYTIDGGTGCWLWNHARDRKRGYGYAVNPRTGKSDHAFRVIYERHRGQIPDGMELDHLCRNHPCVNPWHMEIVTHAVNMRRGAMAKLSAESAEEIRRLHGTMPIRQLAERFGVCCSTIHRVVSGRAWK